MTMKSKVSIVKASYDNIYRNLSKAIDLVGGLDIADKKKIVIKVNLCDARPPSTGAITHPKFLDAVLRYLRENFNELEIYVVESDARMVLADLYIRWFGLLSVMEKWGAKWCNLSKDKVVKKKINGLYFKEIDFPQVFEDCYFITLPKLKTNILTKMTCCLKNQFGCLTTVNKARYHRWIHDVIVDVNKTFKPDFCIVDGIISMVGCKGPAFGMPVKSELLLAGKDPVAVDTVCAKIMGFRPSTIGYIRKAEKVGIGSMTCEIVSEINPLPRIDSKWSKVELLMLKLASYLQKRASK